MTGASSVGQRWRAWAERVRRWRAERPPPEADAAFEAEGLAQCRRGMRVYSMFALALLVVSAIDSYVTESDRFFVLLRIRVMGAAALVAVFALLSSRHGVRWPRAFAFAFVLIMSVTIHALALQTG